MTFSLSLDTLSHDKKVREGLAAERLQAVKDNSPVFFDRLVIDLLVWTGYGGTRKDAGQSIGKNGNDLKASLLGVGERRVALQVWQAVYGRLCRFRRQARV